MDLHKLVPQFIHSDWFDYDVWLDEKIVIWLDKLGIDYSIFVNIDYYDTTEGPKIHRNAFILEFQKPSDEILFKLVWM